MGVSKNSSRVGSGQKDGVIIRWVGKVKGGCPVNHWCKTTRENGKFKQDWSIDKPQA